MAMCMEEGGLVCDFCLIRFLSNTRGFSGDVVVPRGNFGVCSHEVKRGNDSGIALYRFDGDRFKGACRDIEQADINSEIGDRYVLTDGSGPLSKSRQPPVKPTQKARDGLVNILEQVDMREVVIVVGIIRQIPNLFQPRDKVNNGVNNLVRTRGVDKVGRVKARQTAAVAQNGGALRVRGAVDGEDRETAVRERGLERQKLVHEQTLVSEWDVGDVQREARGFGAALCGVGCGEGSGGCVIGASGRVSVEAEWRLVGRSSAIGGGTYREVEVGDLELGHGGDVGLDRRGEEALSRRAGRGRRRGWVGSREVE